MDSPTVTVLPMQIAAAMFLGGRSSSHGAVPILALPAHLQHPPLPPQRQVLRTKHRSRCIRQRIPSNLDTSKLKSLREEEQAMMIIMLCRPCLGSTRSSSILPFLEKLIHQSKIIKTPGNVKDPNLHSHPFLRQLLRAMIPIRRRHRQ